MSSDNIFFNGFAITKFMLGQVRAHVDMIFGCRVERRWLRSREVLQGVAREVMSHACKCVRPRIKQEPNLDCCK
jgi:hypothetical protein